MAGIEDVNTDVYTEVQTHCQNAINHLQNAIECCQLGADQGLDANLDLAFRELLAAQQEQPIYKEIN